MWSRNAASIVYFWRSDPQFVPEEVHVSKSRPLVRSNVRELFASRLRKARQHKGFRTARSFADALSIDENRYSRWERAQVSPDFFMLERICSELAVTPNDLLLSAVEDEEPTQELEKVEAAT